MYRRSLAITNGIQSTSVEAYALILFTIFILFRFLGIHLINQTLMQAW